MQAKHKQPRSSSRSAGEAVDLCSLERVLREALEPISAKIGVLEKEITELRAENKSILPRIGALEKEVRDLSILLRHATRDAGSDSIDPRQKFIAGVIQSRPSRPKMTLPQILGEAEALRKKDQAKSFKKPYPNWRVSAWTDVLNDRRLHKCVQSWVSKIRGKPQYLRAEYLSDKGKMLLALGAGSARDIAD